MGYYMAMNANKLELSEEQMASAVEQVEALQLTEEEVAELDAE